MTTLTCDHCDSEIDIATDKNCVVYDPSGITAVICENCRMCAWERWQDSITDGDNVPSIVEQQRKAYRIKRGWRA